MLEFIDRSFSFLICLLLMLLKISVNSSFLLKVYIIFLCATNMQNRGDVSRKSSYALWPFVVIRSLPAVAPSIQMHVSMSSAISFALNPHCFESSIPLYVPKEFQLSHSDHKCSVSTFFRLFYFA